MLTIRSALACFLIANLPVSSSVLAAAEPKNVTIILVGPSYEYPKVPLHILSIQRNGNLIHTDGAPIALNEMKKYLNPAKLPDGKVVNCIRIQVASEDKITTENLSKTLEKIRGGLESTDNIIIFLRLH